MLLTVNVGLIILIIIICLSLSLTCVKLASAPPNKLVCRNLLVLGVKVLPQHHDE